MTFGELMSTATGPFDGVWLAQAPQDKAAPTTRVLTQKFMLGPLLSAPTRQYWRLEIEVLFHLFRVCTRLGSFDHNNTQA
jgi:hypothetical protein